MPDVQPTVFIVDDDQPVRELVAALMASVALKTESFGSAQAFLDTYDADRSGCLVLDVRMPGMTGLELQQELHRRHCGLPIIMLTGFGDVATAVQALKAGALAFIEKPFSRQALIEHVHRALARDARQRREREECARIESRLALLSQREREVMELVVAGKPNKAVAAELGISKKTVDAHRAQVMRKMQVDSLAELVRQVLIIRLARAGKMEAAFSPDPFEDPETALRVGRRPSTEDASPAMPSDDAGLTNSNLVNMQMAVPQRWYHG